MNDLWLAITAISATVQAIAVVVALVYAAAQIKNAIDDRHLELIFRLHNIFDDAKARDQRRYIFNKLPSQRGTLSRKEYETVRDVWNTMDLLGRIAYFNLASRRVILKMYSRVIARLWVRLEPHIEYYRTQRGQFALYFEYIAEESKKYRLKHFGEKQPHFYTTVPEVEKKKGASRSAKVLTRSSSQKAIYNTNES